MRIERTLWVAVVLVGCTAVTLADKRALEIADYHLLQDVSDPAFAPRGDAIVYTVSASDLDNDAPVSDLWRVSWRGGEPLQLTHTPHASEWLPQWRSDGKAIAFLSDRGAEDNAQIWLMNYTESMAKGFAFLSVVVTAANLPLYLFCALAILVLWRRGEISRPSRREMLLVFAATIATVFSVWLFIGVGIKSLLWAVALALVGVPVYWWMRRSRMSALGLRDGV